MDAFDLPAHVKPRFDPAAPPDDIASNPARWDYWAPTPSGDLGPDFVLGANIARDLLADDDYEITRGMIAYALATMRDKGAWGDVETGFVSLIGRKAQVGARPSDLEDATPSSLTGVQRSQFQIGMTDALADMEWAASNPMYRILPARIMDRIGRAVVTQEHTPEFAGYATTIIAAAVACGDH